MTVTGHKNQRFMQSEAAKLKLVTHPGKRDSSFRPSLNFMTKFVSSQSLFAMDDDQNIKDFLDITYEGAT